MKGILVSMSKADNKADRTARAWKNHRQRLRLECRECEVICERVVSPWHCLRSGCTSVYAYEEGDTTYFGCLHKVFAAELDLAAFAPSDPADSPEPHGAGVGARVTRLRRESDPYGPLRAFRSPLPQCAAAIERVYSCTPDRGGCCNPIFFHHPDTAHDDGIRMITNSSPDRNPDPRDQ